MILIGFNGHIFVLRFVNPIFLVYFDYNSYNPMKTFQLFRALKNAQTCI